MASTDIVHFNLDTAERPAEQQFELFAAVVNGRRIEITDPAELDYQDLLTIDNPLKFFKHCMAEEDRDYLAEQKLKGWQLGQLLENFLTHYKAKERIDDRMKQREALGF